MDGTFENEEVEGWPVVIMTVLQHQRFGVWDIYPTQDNTGREVSLWIAQDSIHIKNQPVVRFEGKGRIKAWSITHFTKKLGLDNEWFIGTGTSTIPELPDGLLRTEIGQQCIIAHPTHNKIIHVKVDSAGAVRIHAQTLGQKREKISDARETEQLARDLFSKIQTTCAHHRINITFARFSFAQRLSDQKLVPIGGLCDPDLAGLEFMTKKSGVADPVIRLGRDEIKKAHAGNTSHIAKRSRDKWRTFQTL
ncbi:MAG: hypothetical protein ABIP54_04900, partial [Candidatus Andersenbacteria bacterium]